MSNLVGFVKMPNQAVMEKVIMFSHRDGDIFPGSLWRVPFPCSLSSTCSWKQRLMPAFLVWKHILSLKETNIRVSFSQLFHHFSQSFPWIGKNIKMLPTHYSYVYLGNCGINSLLDKLVRRGVRQGRLKERDSFHDNWHRLGIVASSLIFKGN